MQLKIIICVDSLFINKHVDIYNNIIYKKNKLENFILKNFALLISPPNNYE
jgi:hypothetical protein